MPCEGKCYDAILPNCSMHTKLDYHLLKVFHLLSDGSDHNLITILFNKARIVVGIQSSVQSCLTLCDPMDCSMPGFPVYQQVLEIAQTHVHWVDDAIQSSHPLSSPSLLAFNLSKHQSLFQWVSSSHQVAKVLEFQLQSPNVSLHQSFQWTPRTDLL